MADRRDLDFTYSLTDRIIRLSLGELPDFSGAMFDGDFSLGLEQAQRRKHAYVADQAGRQEEIYRDLFARVSNVLPPGGRFYLQTMVFGRNMIPASRIDLEALRAVPPRDSDEWYIALLGRQFPGSWLPLGQEQVVGCAEPHFRLVSSVSGRLDYIETINRWNARIGAPSFGKTLLKLRLLPRWLTSADFRLAFTSGVSADQVCFQRELLDHYRLVFENRH